MKINDVEHLLGITKANIRFYEKEGLISPVRSANGYREYSPDDIRLLKDIIILRKLGIPVQQIADILDGAVPLQTALQDNITSLQTEIEKLNGALLLSRQLVNEDARMLDTERYWEIIQKQESDGFRFQSLVEDYLKFSEVNYQWLFWPLPVEDLRSPKKVCTFVLAFSALAAVLDVIAFQRNYPLALTIRMLQFLCSFLIWTSVFFPLYLLSKRKPKLANGIMTALLLFVPIAAVIGVVGILLVSFS